MFTFRMIKRFSVEAMLALGGGRSACSLVRSMPRVLFAISLLSYFVHDARAGGNESLEKFGQQMSYFYLNPTKQNYDQLQSGADRFAVAMANLRNKSDVSAAVFLARISQKYNWDITGKQHRRHGATN